MKLQELLEGFMSPFPAKEIETVQTPLDFGRIVTRGPRESSSVYSETEQILPVEVEKVIPLSELETLPSVERTLAKRNAPVTGTEDGAITFTRVDCRENCRFWVTGAAAKKLLFPD